MGGGAEVVAGEERFTALGAKILELRVGMLFAADRTFQVGKGAGHEGREFSTEKLSRWVIWALSDSR